MDYVVVGNRIRLKGEFRNIDKALADPTAVVIRLEDPSGNVDEAAASNESPGVYYYDLTVDEAGPWHYRFVGSGALVATNPEEFIALAARP